MHRRFLISRFFIVCIGFVLSEIQIVAAESFPQVRFTPLPSDILPSNEVRKLYQDSDGYIWIPTYNGLARYDGYGAITYGMRDVSNGLFNTFVNVVAEDHDKNLWIGTEHGLFRLDKVSGNIVADEYPELADCNIAVILCDTGNGIWIGGDKGLFRKNALDRNFHPVPISNSAGRPVKAVTSIIKDDKLNLWIAAFDQGLLRYDIREDRAYACDDAVLRKAHVLARDVAGNIWVGTWGAGVVRLVNPLAPGPTRYVHYKHVPGRTHSLLDDIIYDIEENPEQNTIWIGGRSGLSILHDIDNPDSFQNFFPGDNVGDLPYNEVNSILRTRDGLMWIGLLGGGVCKVQTSGTKFESDRLEPIRTRYNTSSVRSMYYAGNGDFWFGLLDFGLIKYNIRSGKIVDYHEHPDLKSLPYTSTVNTIIRRSTTGELYFGTQNAGIWVYNETQHKVRQINHFNQPNFLDDCVIALCEDTHGNLWIGSRLGIYVESTDGRFHTAAEWLGYATPFDQTYVFDICCDKAGDVWIASNGQGILHIRTADGTWRQYTRDNGMISDHVYCLQADDTGCIWAGTFADGLCTAPQKLDTFGVFFMKYNYEIRLKAVKLVLEGGLSVREAGCHLGCGRSQVHLWVTLFERHGLAGLKLRHGSYSAEFKLSVLKHMHQNHLSLLETAVHFGIPGPFVIRQWERLYQNQGAEGLRRKPQRRRPAMSKSKTKKVKLKTTPHEELLKELEYLRAENAYLKKLQALVEERIVRESGKEPKPSKD